MKKYCPVCEINLPDTLPSLCHKCGWDLNNDITMVPSIDEIPEQVKKQYDERLELARRGWHERLELLKRQKELEDEVKGNQARAEELKVALEKKSAETKKLSHSITEAQKIREISREERNRLEKQRNQASKRQKKLEANIEKLEKQRDTFLTFIVLIFLYILVFGIITFTEGYKVALKTCLFVLPSIWEITFLGHICIRKIKERFNY